MGFSSSVITPQKETLRRTVTHRRQRKFLIGVNWTIVLKTSRLKPLRKFPEVPLNLPAPQALALRDRSALAFPNVDKAGSTAGAFTA